MRKTVLGKCLFFMLGVTPWLRAEVPENLPQLEAKWNEVALGGETSCSRGTPFSLFVYPGKINKVVIDYMGGGACWNAGNCAPGSNKTFLESIEEIKTEHKELFEAGIYDHTNPENPFKDWHHVVVPYCTGDIHWGENDQTYTKRNKSFVIKHRGAVNSKAVLSWVQQHFKSPEKVLVTGYSAGAYGALYWYPHVVKMYPDSKVIQFADSGMSPITESFAKLAFKEWGVEKNRPSWIPGLDPAKVNWSKLQVDYIYKQITDFYPQARMSAFTSAFDGTQRIFYALMDSDTPDDNIPDWPILMKNMVESLGRATPQFNYFLAPGHEHCLLPYASFYTAKSANGLFFKDWFKAYVEGGNTPNVPCSDCKDDSESEMDSGMTNQALGFVSIRDEMMNVHY